MSVHSVAFQIFGFTVYWYGVLAAVGFLSGYWTAMRRAPRAGVSPEAVSSLIPWIMLGAALGARLLYVISYSKEFADEPWYEMILPRRGGFVFYGGLIGSAITTLIFCQVRKIPLWSMADVMAPSIALGHVFGRFGCLMTGCCYGSPTNVPWAIHFPLEHWTHGIGVHPTQIYEAGLNLVLFLVLSAIFQRRRFTGQVFACYLIGYAFVRSFVELFRGDYDTSLHFVGGLLTPGQLVSVGTLATGIGLWWLLRRNPVQRVQPKTT